VREGWRESWGGVLCTRNPNEPDNEALLQIGNLLYRTECLGLPAADTKLSQHVAGFRVGVAQLVQ
jgi:hypothetical protein